MCRTLLFLFCLFVASTAVAQQASTAKKAKQTPLVVGEINDAMQKFVASGDVSGAVTIVSHRGKIIHLGAVGLSDLERQREMKVSSLFAIASMTKPIVATGLLILQDDGKLSVDDEVSKYLPAFAEVKLKDGASLARPMTIEIA